jgi:hypothetical protein
MYHYSETYLLAPRYKLASCFQWALIWSIKVNFKAEGFIKFVGWCPLNKIKIPASKQCRKSYRLIPLLTHLTSQRTVPLNTELKSGHSRMNLLYCVYICWWLPKGANLEIAVFIVVLIVNCLIHLVANCWVRNTMFDYFLSIRQT